MTPPERATRTRPTAVLLAVAALAGLALATYAGLGGISRTTDPTTTPTSETVAALRYRQGAVIGGGRIWRSQVRFADVDGNRLPDLGVVSRLADGPWLFRNQGDGRFAAEDGGLPRDTFCGGGMDFADVDKDGKIDLAIADHCKGLFVFLGDGNGNWQATPARGFPTLGVEDVALGDFDHDGCIDLVAGVSAEEGITALRGNCQHEWTPSADGLAADEWANTVKLVDLNGDGNLDVAAAHAAGPRVWLGDGHGAWRSASVGLPAPNVHGLYWGVDVGDLNGDGRLDLAATSQMAPADVECGAPGKPSCSGGGLQIFLQQADGSWRESNRGVTPMTALGVAIGDLDNDGAPDVVAVGKSAVGRIGGVYGIFAYLGDGSGNWQAAADSGLPATGLMRTWGVGLADVDNDGRLDIGVALGDVVSPSRRASKDNAAGSGALLSRGHFGEIQLWLQE